MLCWFGVIDCAKPCFPYVVNGRLNIFRQYVYMKICSRFLTKRTNQMRCASDFDDMASISPHSFPSLICTSILRYLFQNIFQVFYIYCLQNAFTNSFGQYQINLFSLSFLSDKAALINVSTPYGHSVGKVV